MKLRVLFVDDELRALENLKRALRGQQDKWEMGFARNGLEALSLMAKSHFDVVVSDMVMPGMDGASLLTEVMRRYPETIRFILSDQATREKVYQSIGTTHQFLTKPCEAEILVNAVNSAISLRNRLNSDNLRKLVSKIGILPSVQAHFLQVVKTIEDSDASLAEVGKMISRDLGMSAKILQLVNSSFFGLRQHVTNPVQAVCLLGLDVVKSLVVWFRVGALFSGGLRVACLSPEALQRHSLAVGALAQAIAMREGLDKVHADEFFMAGLFHDMGKLILAANLPRPYSRVLMHAEQVNVPIYAVEQGVFGTTHAEVGAYLLGLWGFADPVVEACCYHHHPKWHPGRGFTTVTAVYAANMIHSEQAAKARGLAPPKFDLEYLQAAGMEKRLPVWQALYEEMQQMDKANQRTPVGTA